MTSKVLATVAIAGAVATFAILNVNGPQTGTNFLQASNQISEAERAFINFISQYHRSYGTKEEYNYRLSVFENNYNLINTHNQQNDATYTMDVNNFADMSAYEYKQLLGYKKTARTNKRMNTLKLVNSSVPDSVDWRTTAVTPVKNQGSCGSCWAFSTTGSLEGANQIKTGSLTSFSEQQLVDCAGGSYGNQGCNGGLMDSAFDYIHDHPLTTESAYPYTGVDGTCHAPTTGISVASHVDVAANSPTALQQAVAQQPVSVAIEADRFTFQLYSKGIITSTGCGTNLDHGVLVVGYGTEGKQDYWILKNSWGPTWGESGFFRIARDMTKTGPGICGLQEQPVYPVL